MSAIGAVAKMGTEMRVGLYRIAGAGPNKNFYAWQPTGEKSFHVPRAFGRLRLVN
jgi:hypothetical protein